MEDLTPRVDRLEWRMEAHSEQLKRLHETTAELTVQLSTINRTLIQIKWLAIGVGIVLAGQSMGLGTFLKLVGV